ncbi:type II CAAX endopeptidase family protein [Jeotgalibacillus sp. ET6]|uniref:CPBP family intramembrane glutamic endopeptidase n=1 Tax=Jeotgalibacillus sp. ET6 TaxID=3037260 RepID=UPI00241823CC|nr:type II CAAX endopeptidase family protein [Jeotgalibacillus sp. ET6]MDG5471238.1 type II CAAX endopeptidase family protein [Jeotgalibacillus sp. ET6]
MKMNHYEWKNQDKWGRREFVLLLFIEFVFIIGGIKLLLGPMYALWLGDELYAGTLMGLTIAVVLTSSVYTIALRPQKLSWGEVGVRNFAAKDWRIIILYSIVLLAVAVIIVVLTSFIGNSWENSKTDAMKQNVTLVTIMIAFISAAVISPLYEEIFYRGFIYRWLRTRIGFKAAILISSAIFTIIHIPTYNVMPVNFVSGAIFALAYERTNSIWPSVFIHGITNGIMVLLASLG